MEQTVPLSDFSGVIPPAYSTAIIQEVIQQSAALQLGTRAPMGTHVQNMPVPSSFPVAAWVTAGGTPTTRVDTCGTTTGSTTVTDASVLATDVGAGVSGAGVPAGAIITIVEPGVNFTLSIAATATAASASLTLTKQATGRKPYTSLGLQNKTMTAEEVAAVVAIPNAMIEDSTIDLWGFARPLLSQAIAIALDQAVLFGINAPATFPAGGVVGMAQAGPGSGDAVTMINGSMSLVENQGLAVTGSSADLRVRGKLRNERASGSGELLLGWTSVDNYTVPTLFGVPIAYTPYDNSQLSGGSQHDFITGAWKYLIIGVRDDIRFDMNPAAVIADSAGLVQVSGWQDNVTPLKVWARFAAAIISPVTPRVPTGSNPFAMCNLSAATLFGANAEAQGQPPAKAGARA
jgi:hypothetical protein